MTLSNMVTGIIAFIFSIILSRKLGAEGLGLYGLIMPVYGLLLCITCDGIITAVSKISAVYYCRRDFKNLNKTTGILFAFVILWAASVAFLVLICHNLIAVHIVRDARAAAALMVLSPAIVFITVSAVIKGYFYGLSKYKITATVDIFEKFLRVVILLSTIAVIRPESVDGTVAIAYFALAVGELLSMSMLFLCYKVQKGKLHRLYAGAGNDGVRFRTKSRIQLLIDVLVISWPLGINGILSSIISTLSTLVLPRRIVAAGFTYNEALALIGRFGGMALNISFLPHIVISSMLTVLVPELSLNISKKDFWSAEERIAQVLKLAAAVGISTAIVLLTIPNTLGQLFYQRSDLGEFIKFSAPICLVCFLSSPTFGILNALGKQNILLKNSLIISLENLFLIVVLAGIPRLNIYGDGLAMILSSLTALIINIKEIKKICEIKIVSQDIIALVLAGVTAYLVSGIAGRLLIEAAASIKVIVVVVTSFLTVIGLGIFVNSEV